MDGNGVKQLLFHFI